MCHTWNINAPWIWMLFQGWLFHMITQGHAKGTRWYRYIFGVFFLGLALSPCAIKIFDFLVRFPYGILSAVLKCLKIVKPKHCFSLIFIWATSITSSNGVCKITKVKSCVLVWAASVLTGSGGGSASCSSAPPLLYSSPEHRDVSYCSGM